MITARLEKSATPVRAIDSGADSVRLRNARHEDLDGVNDVIAAAVDSWRLADRVKRLSLPLYRYDTQDLDHLQVIVAENEDTGIVGVASLEMADAADCPEGCNAALLHGIYVDPRRGLQGIGTRLLRHIMALAQADGFDGLLVRASPQATRFFEARGFEKLPAEGSTQHYRYRYWQPF